MKKTLVALAALASMVGVAHAQSSVTLYGSIDAGLRDQTNTTKAGGNKIGMSSNGNYNSNRWGIRGVEDLGGGYSAHFNLEAGFNSGTGALNNTNNLLFERTALVGITGPFGTVNLGHMFDVAHDTIAKYDPFDLKYLSITEASAATNGVSGRDDNVIRYNGRLGGLVARAELSLGGQAGSVSEGSTEAAGFTYATGPFSVGGAYTHKSKSNAQTLTAPFFNDNHYTVGGAYKLGPVRFSVGYTSETRQTAMNQDVKDKYLWGGVKYTITPVWAVTAAYYDLKNTTADISGRKDVAIAGVTYALSKRTNLYADIDNTHFTGGYVTNSTLNPSQRSNQFGASIGINHWF